MHCPIRFNKNMKFTRFSSIFNHESKNIESGAFVVAISGAISAILGIFRNALLAYKFGAGPELDMYFASFRIPDFIYSIFVFGALSAGFIPVFNKWVLEDKEKSWELVSAIINLFVLVLGGIAIFVVLFSRQVVFFITPGFSEDQLNIISGLLKIMMIQPILLAISNVISSTLQSFKRFFIPSLSPVFYNLGIIVGIILFSNIWGIWGLAIGVILGAVLHLGIQIPSLLSIGFKWHAEIRKVWVGVKEIIFYMLPRMANLFVVQFNLFVITALSSFLKPGTLSIYNLAADIAGFPLIVFGMSFATAAFPDLSKFWAKKDYESYKVTVLTTLSEIWFWTISVSILGLIFADQIVRLTLFWGLFSQQSYEQTVNTLRIFFLGLPGQAGILMLIRAFFAIGNSAIPFVSAIFGSFITVSVAFWLGKIFGAPGLALGPALSGFFQSILLLILLNKKIGYLEMFKIFMAVKNSLFSGLFSGSAGWIVFRWLDNIFSGKDFSMFLFKLLISLGITFLIYTLIYIALKLQSIKNIKLWKIKPTT
jgi:putative peptidoglycan lipid II flippase